MGAQGYERVPEKDTESSPAHSQPIPSSPPPSFRSRASSPVSRRFTSDISTNSAVNNTLADTFDHGEGSDEEEDGGDDRQRLLRGTDANTASQSEEQPPPVIERRMNELPSLVPPPNTTRATPFSTFSSSNDGVFANLNAKPERGEKLEEQPPSYEQAAADATPPYWETTILQPGMISDEVYVDGLPVGSLFSFVWNGIISVSFQLVGFLLTYLLHTTHAAKNGSRAGLGINLVQYGFYMRSAAAKRYHNAAGGGDPQSYATTPPNPNSHDFDPSAAANSAAAAVAAMANAQAQQSNGGSHKGFPATEWFAYLLMIVGWFILIRAVTDFVKARRHEQLVLQSPDRGLNVPVVADGEAVETAV